MIYYQHLPCGDEENPENVLSFLFFLKKPDYNEIFFIRSYRAYNK
jgi:hypothetical protein